MTAFWFMGGVLLVGLGVLLLYKGLPINGQIRAVAANTLVGEVYTFAIILSLTMGCAMMLSAVLG